MNEREVRELLKKGEVYNQYILIGDEQLLIDNTVRTIKDASKVNESFDLDTFFISETPIEDIMSKFYLTPFASTQRFIIVKNLEELDYRALTNFAKFMNSTSSKNCLVMTYRVKKSEKKFDKVYKKIAGLFKNAKGVASCPNKALIHKWIISKVKRDNLNLSPSTIRYLEDEFSNDITGLKNEFEKIENYLYEAKTLDTDGIKDLAKGLCDFNKYQIVDAFLKGEGDSIKLLEELRPYLRSYAEIVDALTRGLVFYTQRNRDAFRFSKKSITSILDEIIKIDRRVKKSSYFANLMLELFFLKNANLFKKGAMYAR